MKNKNANYFRISQLDNKVKYEITNFLIMLNLNRFKKKTHLLVQIIQIFFLWFYQFERYKVISRLSLGFNNSIYITGAYVKPKLSESEIKWKGTLTIATDNAIIHSRHHWPTSWCLTNIVFFIPKHFMYKVNKFYISRYATTF